MSAIEELTPIFEAVEKRLLRKYGEARVNTPEIEAVAVITAYEAINSGDYRYITETIAYAIEYAFRLGREYAEMQADD